MRKKTSSDKHDRVLHTPLLQAFRDAAQAGDARRSEITYTEDGARIVTQRSNRVSSNEAALRHSLDIDLGHLLNTVNLAAALDLEDHPHVRRSVLNFGMQDLVHLSIDSARLSHLAESLRTALLAHEPRLNAASLEITQQDDIDEVNQRIAFTVRAEMVCRPVDVPLEFLAEIDVGSGKVDLRNLARPRAAARSGTPAPDAPTPRRAGGGVHIPPGMEQHAARTPGAGRKD
ncbi:type VI secretion system baseplate subunit TssE [Roseinatronobacter alkalisoli]|uniref:Type VI secretion system baseplate subunit TssE n=1 Tax=Roseinatronobacter alkalisoli TaxID=3028235 RepID=A0ABT5TCL0_9RHOB|nr:type VI secretion system baseplate subunit TssE [Roseinatronobacter sp. HJB301]MDD7972866.1 type VI secretion system baseplate subunit TssE [Roseinatronobacter sp. HJB301]